MAFESESSQGSGSSNNAVSSANVFSTDMIRSGEWYTGALSTPSDVDYFKFDATPSLLTVQVKSSLISNQTRWKVDLLNASGDYLRTLASSASGTLTAVAGVEPTQAVITGLSTQPTVGSKFTLKTSSADTAIYTVVSNDGKSGSAYTVTLDKSFASVTADTAIAFDPAQINATGGLTSLQALIDAAGTYYIKVSAAGYSDADYAVRVALQNATETGLSNNTYSDARDDNARLIPGLAHQGTIDTTADIDYWLISTAAGSTFTLDFAPATSAVQSTFAVSLYTWSLDGSGSNVLTDVLSASGSVIGATFTGAKTFTIDGARYPAANTFAVKVTSTALTGTSNTGAYTIKASGTGLDINDTPVIQVGERVTGKPLENLDLTNSVLTSVKKGADSKIALSKLFAGSDADTAQTLTYVVKVDAATNSNAVGSIKVEPSGGTVTTYASGANASLTAAQLQDAYLYVGTAEGTLKLTAYAKDSSSAPDNSGISGVVAQTIQVTSGSKSITVGTDSSLSLKEKAGSNDAGYQEAITFVLTQAPSSDVLLQLRQDTPQLVLDKSTLTFTTSNWNTAQTVNVTANDDGVVEDTATAGHTGVLRFVVGSTDTAYNGLSLSNLTFAMADPSNSAPVGKPTFAGTLTQGTASTVSVVDIADSDGLGTLNYIWQRSATPTDASSWVDISGASRATFTPTALEANKFLRVKVTYIDGLGKQETVVGDASTAAVVKTNDAPTSADASAVAARSGSYTFKSADFPFTDTDANDALSGIVITSLPTSGSLKYDGNSFALDGGYQIALANIGKLSYVAPTTGTGTASASFDFLVADRAGDFSPAKTMTLTVSTPPTAAPPAALTALEDTAYVLAASAFGFSDADTGDTLQKVKVTALPTKGLLKVDGVTVVIETGKDGQEISIADINANKLTYVAVANENGQAYASFQYKVFDGTVYSTTAATMTLNVTAVNDAPTLTSVPTQAPSRSAGVVFSLDDVTVADVDSSTLTLSLVATNGTLLGLTDADANTAGIQLQGTASTINAAFARASFVGTADGVAAVAMSLSDGSIATTANYPITITAPASSTDTDGDGVSNALEGSRDGNADGIPDQYQSNVAAVSAKVTLVAQSTAGIPPVDAVTKITGLTQAETLGTITAPVGMTVPGGVLTFNAQVTSGATENFSLLVASDLAVNGYWQKNSVNNTWVNLAAPVSGGSITQVSSSLTRLDFVLTDGGPFDASQQAGVISATGLLGQLDKPGLVGVPVVMPTDGFWF